LFIHSCTHESPAERGFELKEARTPPKTLKIQNFELPAHVQASRGDVPVCKGFAFITFAHIKDAQRFLTEWPWTGTNHSSPSRVYNGDEAGDTDVGDQLMNLDLTKEKNEHEEAVKEGIESGLRAISLYVRYYHRFRCVQIDSPEFQERMGRVEDGVSVMAS
jgi:hypothetical protein